jgi:hypothetical protein
MDYGLFGYLTKSALQSPSVIRNLSFKRHAAARYGSRTARDGTLMSHLWHTYGTPWHTYGILMAHPSSRKCSYFHRLQFFASADMAQNEEQKTKNLKPQISQIPQITLTFHL